MNLRPARSVLPALLWAAFTLFPRIGGTEPSYITFPSDVPWVTQSSEHFQILYRKGRQDLAERTLRAAERSYRLLTPIFPEAPPKTWIVLADFVDATNGYALNFPFPHMVLFAAPPSPHGTLATLDDWLESVVLHEYVHTLHLYPAGGLWGPLRALFGSIIVPNGLMPSHLHEGLAVFLETHQTAGGRGRSALWRMYRRKAVEAGVWGKSFVPLDLIDGSDTEWPHGTSPYFFGYYFYESLWKAKGAKGIHELTTAYSNNWPYFIQTPFAEVFGADYTTLWQKTFERTGTEARKELEELKKQPLSKPRYLTRTGFAKWDLAVSPDGRYVAYRAGRPDTQPRVEILDLNKGTLAHTFPLSHAGTGLCWGRYGKRSQWVYLETQSEHGYRRSAVRGRDQASGSLLNVRIKNDGFPPEGIHHVACSPDLQKILLYQEVGGEGYVILTQRTGGAGELGLEELSRWPVPQGHWISGLVVGRGIWIAVRSEMRTTVFRWEPPQAPRKAWDLPGHLFNLTEGTEPETLEAIWDRDGRYEVWSISGRSGKATKRIGLSGGTISFARRGNRWIASSYEHGGYDIAELAPIQSASIQVPSAAPLRRPASENYPVSRPEPYSPWSTLAPRTWIPNLLVVPDGAQISAYIPVFDISQRHFYDLYLGYDTRGSAFASGAYSYRFAQTQSLDVGAYFAPSYIASSRIFLTRWGASMGWKGRPFGNQPVISLSALYNKFEPYGSYAGKHNVGAGLGISYHIGFEPSRAIDVTPRWGTSLSAHYSHYLKALGASDNFWVARVAIDQYLPAPWWDGHGWYLRGRAGYTEGTHLLNSYFEGGGELAFSQGRNFFQNRGFHPGTFFGQRFVNASLEYRFPISRIDRGIGLLPAFFDNLHGALVADISSSDLGKARQANWRANFLKVYYGSYGVELKTSAKIGYYLPASFRFGLYKAVADFKNYDANGYPTNQASPPPDLYFSFGVEASL